MSAFSDRGPTAVWLADGRRLHLQHGPIDLIIEADGRSGEVRAAYEQAVVAFKTVLVDLVDELALLRTRMSTPSPNSRGPVARRMGQAVAPFATGHFITPMAAVAGSVADHVRDAMLEDRLLDRAYVNNGGDISLFLNEGRSFDIGVCSDPRTGEQASRVHIEAEDDIGGVATSGWRGRSHSLGIADAVTVLARNASTADAAATLIANAVDLPGSKLIERVPASDLAPDSDLGDRPVTTKVPPLPEELITQALRRGVVAAKEMSDRGLIKSAFLSLQGRIRAVPEGGEHAPATKNLADALECANA